MKLLITGAFSPDEEQLNALKDMGHTVMFMQNESSVLEKGYLSAEGIICNGLFLHHDIRKFSNLKYIQLTSAGLDRVPLDYIKEHNIAIHNARGVYSIPMAEFAVCGVLQLMKKSRELLNSQLNHKWKKQRDICELFGKSVCIIGCGSVGTETAIRLSAFGTRVIGVDITNVKSEHFDVVYPLSELKVALSQSDIVILTLPLTDKTKNLINRDALKSFKDGAILVNIARGGVIDTDALISFLESGRLSGAVLDVFEEEPLSEASKLWDMQNVILTPHNSFVGEGNKTRLWSVIKTNLENY